MYCIVLLFVRVLYKSKKLSLCGVFVMFFCSLKQLTVSVFESLEQIQAIEDEEDEDDEDDDWIRVLV